MHKADGNGWKPLHEGARGGHAGVVKLLVGYGSDVNDRTNHGRGVTPLWLAKERFGDRHPIVKFLEDLGALSIGPEL